jgi:hypothetical protein
MNLLDMLFGTSSKAPKQPNVRFGRYTDSYKAPLQYEAWEASLDFFEKKEYLDSYRTFFEYLRDEKEDNVRWTVEDGVIEFELLQGSKRVSGRCNAQNFTAEAQIAHAEKLNVGFMRRLIESNYGMDFCRYALSPDNNIIVKFDTSTLDGSPYKLYHALKEVAINADKQDDLLLDEFPMLKALDRGSRTEISEAHKEIKYQFMMQKIQFVLNELEANRPDASRHAGMAAYMLLDLVYRIDYLTRPEGFVLETLETINDLFFENSSKTPFQKILEMRKTFQKILDRPKELIFKELYETKSTFGVIKPAPHEHLIALIDGEMKSLEEDVVPKYTYLGIAVPSYIIGSCLFLHALPRPIRELLELFYRVSESEYFSALGFMPSYYNVKMNTFDKKALTATIKKIKENNKAKYPNLNPDVRLLQFGSLAEFAASYLVLLKNIDVSN